MFLDLVKVEAGFYKKVNLIANKFFNHIILVETISKVNN